MKHARRLFVWIIVAVFFLAQGNPVLSMGSETEHELNPEADVQYDSWVMTSPLPSAHFNGHTSTLLPDGRVLVVGGCADRDCSTYSASADLFDPVTGSWTATEPMSSARGSHTAVLLQNGKVLVAGGGGANSGETLNSAELYDPLSGTWTILSPMNQARGANAVLLSNGQVLIAGGMDGSTYISSAELYDPVTDHWTYTGSLNTTRIGYLILLVDGKVLMAGGEDAPYNFLTSAELYDPNTGSWTYINPMNEPHNFFLPPIQLNNGKILFAGNPCGYTSELYDPETDAWSYTGSLNELRRASAVTLLPDGKVIAAGGNICFEVPGTTTSVEVYDPDTETWTLADPMNVAKEWVPATVLQNGNVLVVFGTQAEYYDSENLMPLANAGPDQSIYTQSEVTLDGSGSTDPDGDLPLTYQWTQTGGPAISLSDPTSASPSFTAPGDPTTLTFSLVVKDNFGFSSSPDGVIITIRNQSPIAYAGEDDAFALGSLASLDGTGSSDPDGDTPLAYQWTQIDGPTVTLSDSSSPNPTFTAPTTLTYLEFSLSVTDSLGSISQPDSVTIFITNKPTADAGTDQTVNTLSQVYLAGSGQDPDGDIPLSYKWVQTGGIPVTLNDPTILNPSFTAPSDPTTIAFSFVVTDNLGLDSDSDEVFITVNNQPPVSNAGLDKHVNRLVSVTLNGTGSSDPDGHTPLSYQWSQTGGITITLYGSTNSKPFFTTPNTPTTLSFSLVVTDSLGLSSEEDEVTIEVVNQAPTANAGIDQSVSTNSAVTLTGSGIDPENDTPLTFQWEQTGGTLVNLSSATIPNPTFDAPSDPTILTFRLTVKDSFSGSSSPDEVVITVNNQAPTADAGSNQTILTNTLVTLNGSGSDPDGDIPLSYQWVQTNGTAVTLNNSNTTKPTFISPGNPALLTFELVVTDSLGLESFADEVQVEVNNRIPISNAGFDQSVSVHTIVLLDGSLSRDPDGDLPLSFHWTQIEGKTVPISDPTASNPTFTAPTEPGALTFSLVVTDNLGLASAADEVTILVSGHIIFLPLIQR